MVKYPVFAGEDKADIDVLVESQATVSAFFKSDEFN